MANILIVDDEPHVLSALQRELRQYPPLGATEPVTVFTATSGEDALEMVRQTPFAAILSDYRMPDLDGVAFLSECRFLQPDAARIIMSGLADIEGLIKAINEAKIDRFVRKPWHYYDVVSALGDAIRLHRMLREHELMANELQRLEAENPGLSRLVWDGLHQRLSTR